MSGLSEDGMEKELENWNGENFGNLTTDAKAGFRVGWERAERFWWDARVTPPEHDQNYLVWVFNSWDILRFVPALGEWRDPELSDWDKEWRGDTLDNCPYYKPMPPAPCESAEYAEGIAAPEDD